VRVRPVWATTDLDMFIISTGCFRSQKSARHILTLRHVNVSGHIARVNISMPVALDTQSATWPSKQDKRHVRAKHSK
jgi:hypothetical protein